MMALQGKRGQRRSWKYLGPDEDSQHSSAEGCVLILLQRWQCILGEWGFLAGLFLDQGTGKRLGQVACLCSATSPTSSHCLRRDHTSFSWSDGPRWPLVAIVPCTPLLAQPCTVDHLMSPALLKISLATPQRKFFSIQFSGSSKTKQKYVIY